MKLDTLEVVIRPRRSWEAVDLGILMARNWYALSLKVWLIITLPFFLPIIFLPSPYADWMFFIIWLCKPLFERPLLMILSQGVFGELPSLTTVLKATPKLFAIQTFASLLWRRLSASRSMDLPVIQLEKLSGAQRRTRLSILHRQDSTPARWLTIIGVHLETFLLLSMIAFLAAMVPEEVSFSLLEFSWWESQGGLLVTALLSYVSIALIAPFYVACGFSLYLNRRVKLEGWDLEIAFKRMVHKRRAAPAASALLLSLLCWNVMAPQPSLAQGSAYTAEEQAELEARQSLREEVIEIVSQPPFRNTDTVKVRKEAAEEEADLNTPDLSFLADMLRFMQNLLTTLAVYFEVILWAAVVLLVLFVATKFKRWQQFFLERGYFQREQFKPTTLFGMEVTEQSLPANISAEASKLWQQGDPRGALGLLYRASLARLLSNGVPLREGSTEQECLQLVSRDAEQHQVPARVVEYFTQLTALWRQLAYGHIQPPQEQAQQLCENWNQYWLGQADAQ